MNNLTKNKKGFTLAELMAVVMIVAILAGIAIGAYHKAIERSQVNEGLSMANAIMSAADQYFYDFNTHPSSLANLSLDLKGTIVGKTLTTDKFTYTLLVANTVTAVRNGGNYKLIVYSGLNGNTRAPSCEQTASGGSDFCKSVGY